MSLHDRFVQSRDGRQDSELPDTLGRLVSFHRFRGDLFEDGDRRLRRLLRTNGWRMVGMGCLAVAAAIVTFLLATR